MNNALDKIAVMFNELKVKHNQQDLMQDGILDKQKYDKADPKILWILKQDYYDSGAAVISYADRIRSEIEKKGINGKGTWPAMSLVSHGLLSGKRDVSKFPPGYECAERLFETAIIEVNKELGDSRSDPQVIRTGFERYKELVFLQIDTFKPDVVIVGLPEALKDVVDSLYWHCHVSKFIFKKPNVIIDGADVAIGAAYNPLFFWTYHPQATRGNLGGISNVSYTMSLLQAYDRAMDEKRKQKT